MPLDLRVGAVTSEDTTDPAMLCWTTCVWAVRIFPRLMGEPSGQTGLPESAGPGRPPYVGAEMNGTY